MVHLPIQGLFVGRLADFAGLICTRLAEQIDAAHKQGCNIEDDPSHPLHGLYTLLAFWQNVLEYPCHQHQTPQKHN